MSREGGPGRVGRRELIRLRGHHILCTANFVGRGYSLGFVKCMEEIVERMRSGEGAVIVEGCDDICLSCPHMRDGRCVKDNGEEEARERDRKALSLFGLSVGEVLRVKSLWSRVRSEELEAICQGCEWLELCKEVVAQRGAER